MEIKSLYEKMREGPLKENWLKIALADDGQISKEKQICKKGGYLWLTSKETGNKALVETKCKSWRCLACRDSVRSLFALRMEYGLQILQESHFITVTFAKDSKQAKTARSAKKVWTRFIREFRLKHPGMEYMGVPELTKSRIPHLHLVIGWKNKLGLIDSCQRKKGEINYKQLDKSRCQCLTHVSSRLMKKITKGESYVAFAVRCYAGGPGFYLGKYLSKEQDRNYMESIGFKRRWSRSPGWPSPQQLHLKDVVDGSWAVQGWSGRDYGKRMLQKGYQIGFDGKIEIKESESEITGDDLRLTMLEEKYKVRTIIDMEARLAKNNWS